MRSAHPLFLFALLCLSVAPALASPDGEALYARNCAACHGHSGHGGVGVPLALPDFLRVASDDYLFATIRLGRPGRVMPAHPQLSNEEIGAIVRHIRSWGPRAQTAAPTGKPIKGDAAKGAAIYAAHCASCHGANGEGGHGTGVTFSRPRDFPIIPPALNNPGFLQAASDEMIKETLVNGREGTAMASFLERGLSERDIDDVVAFVRSFATRPIEWKPAEETEAVLLRESPYDLAETVENVKRAAVGKNFRIIRVQTLEEGLFPAERQNPAQVVVYFCNFKIINEALQLDPRVGLFMPCQVTVVERDGAVELMAINPKYLSRLYNNAELDQACSQMHDLYVEIMEEATL